MEPEQIARLLPAAVVATPHLPRLRRRPARPPQRVLRLLPATFVASIVLAAAPAAAPGFEPLSSFGSFGEGVGQFGSPGDFDIAPDGSLFAPDFFNHRIAVFSAMGQFRFAFGKGVNPAGGDICTAATGCMTGVASTAAGGLNRPAHVAIDPAGAVYVSSAESRRVDAYSLQGEFQFAFGKGVNLAGGNTCTVLTGCRTGIGDASAGSITPRGLAVDATGTVFVAGNNARVDVFSRLGEFQFAFGGGVGVQGGNVCTVATGCRIGSFTGNAGDAAGVDVDITPAGNVAVLDAIYGRVDVFSPQGVFRFGFGKGVTAAGGDTCTVATGCKAGGARAGAGEIAPGSEAVAVDSAGSFYVATGQLTERVEQFSAAGGFVRAFGVGVVDGREAFQVCTAATGCRAGLRLTTIPGATTIPEGVAVDGRGVVYVAENGPCRIERFGEPGMPPTVAPPGSPPPNRPPPTSARSFRFLAVKLNPRKGTATLAVEVFQAGRVLLKRTEIPKAIRTAKSAGIVRLPVVPVREAKRKLSEIGKATVKVVATFTPKGGARLTKGKTLVLKKTLR